MGCGLDRLDLAILRTVQDATTPMWKKQIFRSITASDALPDGVTDISVQTLGRRVDALNDADLLTPGIVEPEDLNRDLIIAYEISPAGADAVAAKREELLRQHLADSLHPTTDSAANVSHLITLFTEEIGLDTDSRTALEECSCVELTALMTAYYLQKDLAEVFTDDQLETLSQELAPGRLTSLVEHLLELGGQEI